MSGHPSLPGLKVKTSKLGDDVDTGVRPRAGWREHARLIVKTDIASASCGAIFHQSKPSSKPVSIVSRPGARWRADHISCLAIMSPIRHPLASRQFATSLTWVT